MFTIVSALVATNGPNAGTADENSDPVAKRKTNANSSASLNALANGHVSEHEDIGELPAEDLNDVRTRELCTKAVSGILLIMLKWFKLSRKPIYTGIQISTNRFKRCSQIRVSNAAAP